MDDGTVGVELDAESGAPSRTQSQSVRKNISLKLKPKMRGRPKKGPAAKRRSQEGRDSQAEIVNTEEEIANENRAPKFDMEEDISKLEAPKFSTIDRGPPEPIHDNNKLKWDYKVNLIGEKVINPMIHCCKKCDLPVLTYGRMIPCKHVFCHDCAKKTDKLCPKCNEKVHRVEQTGLGTVFMCTFGGSCHGNDGCCRTYLSQRDLHAHINHRHVRASVPSSTTPTSSNLTSTVSTLSAPAIVKEALKINHQPPPTNQNEYKPHLPPITVGNASMAAERHPWGAALPNCRPPQTMLGGPHAHLHMGPPPPHIGMTEAPTSVQNPYNLDAATLHLHRASAVAAAAAVIGGQPPRGNMQVHPGYVQAQNALGYGAPSQIPVMSTRTNLITVPIQDESGGGVQRPPPHQGQGPPVGTHHAQASPTGIPYAPPPTLYPPHPRGPPPTMTRPPSLNSYPNPVPVSYATAMTTQAYVQHHQVTHYGGTVPTGSPGGLRTSVAPPPLYNTSQPPPPPPVHHVYGSSAPRTHYPPPPQQPPGYGQGHSGWVGMGAGPAPGAPIRPHPPPPHGMQQQPPGHQRPPMYH